MCFVISNKKARQLIWMTEYSWLLLNNRILRENFRSLRDSITVF